MVLQPFHCSQKTDGSESCRRLHRCLSTGKGRVVLQRLGTALDFEILISIRAGILRSLVLPVLPNSLQRFWKPVLLSVCALAILCQPPYPTITVRGQVLAPTLVKVRCYVFGIASINKGILCEVSVSDLSPFPSPPFGNVTFSACCDPTGGFLPSSDFRSSDCHTLFPAGSFCDFITQGNPCETAAPGGYLQELSGCSVSYWPSTGGLRTIIANYSGDSAHSASSGTLVLEVKKHSTFSSVSCSRDTVAHSATCKAVVMDNDIQQSPPITPTGTASWSSSVRGIFSSTKCSLSGTGPTAFCIVTYRETSRPSPQLIAAAYSGDPEHSESSASTILDLSHGET